MGTIGGQFKKLRGQNGDGEAMRLILEKQLEELSKVTTERTSGAVGTKGQAMETGVSKLGSWRFGKFEGGAEI